MTLAHPSLIASIWEVLTPDLLPATPKHIEGLQREYPPCTTGVSTDTDRHLHLVTLHHQDTTVVFLRDTHLHLVTDIHLVTTHLTIHQIRSLGCHPVHTSMIERR